MGQIEFLLFLSFSEGISPPLGLFSTLKKNPTKSDKRAM
jgi:hypothetical protein